MSGSYPNEPVQTFRMISEDFDRDDRRRYLAGKPWKFVNNLPYKIRVYVYRTHKTDIIGTIPPRSEIFASHSHTGMELKQGDEIHVFWPDYHSKTFPKKSLMAKPVEYEITRPVFLFDDSRTVKIGDIVYQDVLSTSPMIDIHHDIVGIRFHNHLSFPIEIWARGVRIGMMAGDDGTNFMSGSPNSVYLNNDRFGFKIGDEISFVFANDHVAYATIKIIDNYTSDIIVGETTQHFVMANQDRFSYRVDEDNITGTRYYGTQINAAAYGTRGIPRQGDARAGGYEARTENVYGVKPTTRPYMQVLVAAGGVKM